MNAVWWFMPAVGLCKFDRVREDSYFPLEWCEFSMWKGTDCIFFLQISPFEYVLKLPALLVFSKLSNLAFFGPHRKEYEWKLCVRFLLTCGRRALILQPGGRGWNKDHSSLVVPLHNVSLEISIYADVSYSSREEPIVTHTWSYESPIRKVSFGFPVWLIVRGDRGFPFWQSQPIILCRLCTGWWW